jgi:bis(5'-nucleosidyl)-tetraphosphatase
METAVRETMEEAGLNKNHYKIMDGFKKTLRYNVRGKQKRVEYWLSELINPDTPVILSDEHQDCKWLELSQAKKYASYSEMQEALKDAHDFILKNCPS